MGTENFGQLMIFELPIYDILLVLNLYLMGQFSGSLEGKRNRIDAADHLIFNVHHLHDLNLVKKMSRLWRQQVSRTPRLLDELLKRLQFQIKFAVFGN